MTYLIFDLETVVDADRWQPKPEKPDEFPPPFACRVVTIAWMELSKGLEHVRHGTFTDDLHRVSERDALLGFSRLVHSIKDRTLVTFNGGGFDLPVLIARCLSHSVPMPWYFARGDMRKRYSMAGHLDLCDQIADYGRGRMSKLDALAKLIGLPGKQGVDGSSVAELVAAGKFSELERYALSDVAQTAVLLVRFFLVTGHVPMNLAGETERNLVGNLTRLGLLPSNACSWCDGIHTAGPENCR
jgi:3'-5' exonuclease